MYYIITLLVAHVKRHAHLFAANICDDADCDLNEEDNDDDAKELTNKQFNTHVSQDDMLFNLLIATLKPQSNGPSYSNTVIGTLAVDGWAVTFGTRGGGTGRGRSPPRPSSLYQM